MPKRKKLTQAERDHRKHQRKADRMNAAEAKAYGPMFAHMAPVHTAADAEHRWRLYKAGSAEMDWRSHIARSLEYLVLAHVERWVRAHVPQAEPAIALIRRIYPEASYMRSAWRAVLTGRKRVALSHHYDQEAKRLISVEWPEEPTRFISDEDFDRLFPWELHDHSPPETPDERHFEALAAVLSNRNNVRDSDRKEAPPD